MIAISDATARLLAASADHASLGLAALLASLAVGGAAGLLATWVAAALRAEASRQRPDRWQYDLHRRDTLQQQDLLFRWFPGVIGRLARVNRAVWGQRLSRVQREIQAAGLPGCWLADEYLGRTQLVALLLLPVYLYLGVVWMGAGGVAAGLLLGGLTAWYLRRRLAHQARQRLTVIKRRLPFLLDLLTLLMESGSSFWHALRQAVVEFRGHPAAVEFERVLTDMQLGKTRTEALDNLRRRLSDEEIGSIVGAILRAEQLGTPLAEILRRQADLLRIKRSQRAETIAGEAGVNMLLPAMLVMAATVLVILGPFLLNYWYFGWGL